ncbi:MAG: LAGLIDADG family homing endonuclease [Bacilli bacterium]
MSTIVNIKLLKTWLIKKNLYEFVKEMWDSYETSPFSDCWLIQYLCECYQYSIKHFLPQYIWGEWISDEEYEKIQKESGGHCDVRDHLLPDGTHTRNHDLNIAPRHMKLLANNTPILTRNGWKNHGDLVVGDEVISDGGRFVKVIKVHPKDVADLEVVFSNGETIKCNSKHLWKVHDNFANKVKTVETEYLVNKLRISPKMGNVRGNGYRFHLENRTAVLGEDKVLPVNPYVLGAWLGDGNTNHQLITAGIDDMEVINEVEKHYRIHNKWINDCGWGKSIQYEFDKIMRLDLQKLSLCFPKDKDTKHIPQEYLTASVEQRLDLLAGLIDTDGSLIKDEHRYFFITTSERLKDDILTLIASFGWKTSITIQKADGIISKKDGYYIGFNPTFEIPCRIPRKQLNIFSKQRRISITSINKLDIPEEGNCITVEGGMYLAGRTLIQTHNSTIMNILGPSWTIINTPVTVTSVSHSKNLSGEMIIKKQKLFNSEKYKYYFGNEINLGLSKNTADCLELRNGGKTYSVAMDKFTGFGSDIIINDDLISVADARMDGAVLLHARDYYKTTMPSRLNNKTTGVIWHIMQRIGNGDISDLIAEDKGLRLIYSHTEIQAVASHDQTFIYPCSGMVKQIKKGDLLWAERFGDYTQLKMEIGSEDFETQYNQNPGESRLNVIKENMIHYIEDKELEEFTALAEFHYASHDCPVKDKETSDYHGFTEAYSKDNELVITDAFEEHLGYVAEKELFTRMQIIDPSIIQVVEDKANGSALIQDLAKDVAGLVAFNPGTRSKMQRLELASVYMEKGLVRFARTDKVMYLIQQLKKFPLIAHDDITDAFAQLVIYHFTQRQLGVYTGAFSSQNIISSEEINKTNFLIYGATVSGEIIKVTEIMQDNFTDEFIVVGERVFRGIQAFEEFSRNEVLPGNTILDTSPQNRLSMLLTNVYNVIKYDERDRDVSINIMKTGLFKKKIKVSKECKQTINDIAKLRITEQSRERGVDQTNTLDEGMAGCLRCVVTYVKGYSQQWY